MNNTEETYPLRHYPEIFGKTSEMMELAFGCHEVLNIYDTYQFTDYAQYHANQFDAAHKAKVRDTQFPKDLDAARALGKRLVEQASD